VTAAPVGSTEPDFITVQTACAIIGGDKPISEPTFYRRFRHLIEHPSPGITRVRRGKLIAALNGGA
jgi:hypothetical protein